MTKKQRPNNSVGQLYLTETRFEDPAITSTNSFVLRLENELMKRIQYEV